MTKSNSKMTPCLLGAGNLSTDSWCGTRCTTVSGMEIPLSYDPPSTPPPPPPPSDGDDIYRPGGTPQSYPDPSGGSNPYSQTPGVPPPPPPSTPQYPGQSYPAGGYAGAYPQEHPSGTTILVLGILGLLLCAPLGIVAWVMGNNAMKEAQAQGIEYSNAGTIKAGRILGIIATVLLILGIVSVVILFAATGSMVAFSS